MGICAYPPFHAFHPGGLNPSTTFLPGRSPLLPMKHTTGNDGGGGGWERLQKEGACPLHSSLPDCPFFPGRTEPCLSVECMAPGGCLLP